jgi:hypothetical protein
VPVITFTKSTITSLSKINPLTANKMSSRCLIFGGIDGVLYNIFSYIDENYRNIILAKKTGEPIKLFKISIILSFRSNLFEYFKDVLLSPMLCKKVCQCAAAHGHLKGLQWARQNKCPWDSETTSYAAMQGDLEILKWA